VKGLIRVLLVFIILLPFTVHTAPPKEIELVKVNVIGAPSGVMPLLYRVYYGGKVIDLGITTLPATIKVPPANYTEPLKVVMMVYPFHVVENKFYTLKGDFLVELDVNLTLAPLTYNFTYVPPPKPKVRPSPKAPVFSSPSCPLCRMGG